MAVFQRHTIVVECELCPSRKEESEDYGFLGASDCGDGMIENFIPSLEGAEGWAFHREDYETLRAWCPACKGKV